MYIAYKRHNIFSEIVLVGIKHPLFASSGARVLPYYLLAGTLFSGNLKYIILLNDGNLYDILHVCSACVYVGCSDLDVTIFVHRGYALLLNSQKPGDINTTNHLMALI